MGTADTGDKHQGDGQIRGAVAKGTLHTPPSFISTSAQVIHWFLVRQAWTDIKGRTRNKATTLGALTSATGNKPMPANAPRLDEYDKKVLSLLGEAAVKGLPVPSSLPDDDVSQGNKHPFLQYTFMLLPKPNINFLEKVQKRTLFDSVSQFILVSCMCVKNNMFKTFSNILFEGILAAAEAW